MDDGTSLTESTVIAKYIIRKAGGHAIYPGKKIIVNWVIKTNFRWCKDTSKDWWSYLRRQGTRMGLLSNDKVLWQARIRGGSEKGWRQYGQGFRVVLQEWQHMGVRRLCNSCRSWVGYSCQVRVIYQSLFELCVFNDFRGQKKLTLKLVWQYTSDNTMLKASTQHWWRDTMKSWKCPSGRQFIRKWWTL